MALKFFIVPISDLEAAEAELNAFLAGHTVRSVDRRWVDHGPDSFWALSIDYAKPRNNSAQAARSRDRVDFRERLNDTDFVLYAKLRDLRKEVATAEGVPLYNVFNNNQLATMIEKKARSKADLEAIVGVGDARVGKYGERFLALMAQFWGQGDEKSKPAV